VPAFSELPRLIIEHRYAILLPLSFVEGPIVAFFAGTLASAGYFNIYALAAFFFVRDVTVDLGCYAVGYAGGQTSWVRRVLARLGVKDEQVAELRALWLAHPGKTMFLGKLSYGVAAGFIVVAGLVRMPLAIFVVYGSLVAVLHYGVLLIVGYFFGASLGGALANVLERVPQAVLGLSLIAVAYYLFKRRISWMREEELRAKRNAGVSGDARVQTRAPTPPPRHKG
jgi:membrane protein DedA with SNARE-associated domain